ncbi:hypothetical protein C5B42_05130 [Candidatus Cerribacteria bacterium 'Amazon FNV 2010 28 9']|uniref:Uncharacterized protein n=1 Tax=Candidatus Cerribacteria bacterium 'Amazon FNV 2010 28 9' TaxID=2081795 RepID=A0A317JRK1_9BACT|nr:MAG: hypothetical protein C5B42_05130 [Candidatus Cerribacteria bacterium 'Amazon FNV 2010 28 9']
MSKKITAELVALADYAMNAEDKKLSIIGIFDKLFVRTLPSHHPRMVFVTTLVSEPQTSANLVMRILTPSQQEDFKADVTVSFGENGKANLVSNFEGFPIKEIGEYRFLFEQNGKEIVGHTLTVIQLKEQDGKRVAN